MEGREPSFLALAFRHACNLRVQEVCLGDLRLVDLRFEDFLLGDAMLSISKVYIFFKIKIIKI